MFQGDNFEGLRGFEKIAAIPSNAVAMESAYAFGLGRIALLAVSGPSGWGKTRLLEAAAKTVTVSEGRAPRIVDAGVWAEGGLYDPDQPLLLDNLQDGLRSARRRIRLNLALERRARAGKPTMVAMTANHASQVRQAVPLYRSWTDVRIEEPVALERQHVVKHLAERLDLNLSDSLQTILAQRLCGNGRSMEGALKRLKLSGDSWHNDVETIRACGILSPCFEDKGDWDLRLLIQDAAERLEMEPRKPWAMYAMRRWAQLPEVDVASFYEAPSRDVYNGVRRLRERVKAGALNGQAERFAGYIVDRLAMA